MSEAKPSHCVAVIGGAVAGAEIAGALADGGAEVVVFEQNSRPYGKIEDGLPRWHAKQRQMEYAKIDARLDKPNIHFVPRTKLGKDVSFEFAQESTINLMPENLGPDTRVSSPGVVIPGTYALI